MANAATPKVSIGLPVYNGEAYLADTLDCLLSQSYTNIEVVVSDNASSDSTETIANEYVRKDQRVVYYKNRKNVGVAKNYNMAFERSTGKYFKWAAMGDICGTTFIEKCVDILEECDDVVLCYPRTRVFSDDVLDSTDYDDNLDLQFENPSDRFRLLLANLKLNNAMNGVIRSDVLGKTVLHKVFVGSDICLMAELALRGKIREYPEFLFYRRINESTATILKSEEEIGRFFQPGSQSALLFQNTKGIATLYSIVARAPISLTEKAKCFGYLLKRTYWYKAKLNRELKRAVVKRLKG